jgi:hypothetical protein
MLPPPQGRYAPGTIKHGITIHSTAGIKVAADNNQAFPRKQVQASPKLINGNFPFWGGKTMNVDNLRHCTHKQINA